MRGFRNLSLQWRITILTGIVLFGCTAIVTLFSIYNASAIFLPLIEMDPDIPVDAPVLVLDTTAFDAQTKFGQDALWLLLALSFAGTGAAYCAAGRALAPLHRLRREIERIDENQLDERLPTGAQGPDVLALTEAFNDMLERLKESFQRQKQFTSNAAHELKTPLATIRASIQVLQMDESPPVKEYEETIGVVYACAERLNALVDQLLALASAEGEDEAHRVLLEPLCSQAAAEQETYADKEIHVRLRVDGLAVLGNPVLIRQAIGNLLENAFKYNRRGGSVTVSGSREGRDVILLVEDTGRGISPEAAENIFEPFFREDSSRSRRGTGGNGLGLSLVKAVAEREGGSIEYFPRTGGSCFRLVLPAAR